MIGLSNVILTFFLMYQLSFVLFPAYSSRILLGIVGFVALLRQFSLGKKDFLKSQSVRSLLIRMLFLPIYALFVIIINGSGDFSFLKNTINIFVYFVAAYFVASMMVKEKLDRDQRLLQVARNVAWATLIQYILLIAIFFYPSFEDLIHKVFVETEAMEKFETFRMAGVGMVFFQGAVINIFSLLNIAYLIVNEKKRVYISFYIALFVLVSIFGLFVARFTMIGSFLAIVFIFIKMKKKVIIRGVIYLCFALSMIYSIIPKSFLEENENYLRFGFETFYNYSENGSFESGSSNAVGEMFQVYPHTLKTWLIGDGQFVDTKHNEGYYMGIDVGYLRLIFFWGILGVFLLFSIFYYITKENCEMSSKNKVYFYLHFLGYLLLLVKGYGDYSIFFFLLFFVLLCNREPESNQIKINKSCAYEYT